MWQLKTVVIVYTVVFRMVKKFQQTVFENNFKVKLQFDLPVYVPFYRSLNKTRKRIKIHNKPNQNQIKKSVVIDHT